MVVDWGVDWVDHLVVGWVAQKVDRLDKIEADDLVAGWVLRWVG